MSSNVRAHEHLAACTIDEFVEMFPKLGAREMALKLGLREREIYKRRRTIEEAMNIHIPAPKYGDRVAPHEEYPHRQMKEIRDGMVVVFGDCHYWPDLISTAHRALLAFIIKYHRDISLVVANGDIFDGATASRYARIGWDRRPTLKQELETCQERMHEIEAAAGKIDRVWNLGNHDARMETLLANKVPEVEGLLGMSLGDHFPGWGKAWSTWINDDVVIKHRAHGGIHAARTNALNSGRSLITNHLHSQKVAPLTDYNDTRWGCDTGCIAAPGGPQFTDYLEDKWTDWRSGFAALTFTGGRMLQPELIRVHDEAKGEVDFRGRIWAV